MFTYLTTFIAVLALALPTLTLAARPSEHGTYTISPRKFPNLCLAPATPTNGAPLTLKNCDTSDDIVWQWSGQAWHNLASNKCVDVKDGGRWNGNKLQVWECFSYNTNQMYLLPNAQIQWAGQNFCWDLTDGRGEAGNQIQQWNCFDHNDNQMWDFVDAEEVDDFVSSPTSPYPATSPKTPACIIVTMAGSTGSSMTNYIVSASAHASATTLTTRSVSASASAVASVSVTATMPLASTSTLNADADGNAPSLGNGLWVEQQESSSARSRSRSRSSSADGWSVSATATATATAADGTASPSAPAASPSYTPSSSASKLRTRGTKVVDASNNEVVLRGVNLGGFLVFEDWMCGISDHSGNGDRFPQWTLEQRFGEAQTKALMNVWMDNWLVAADFDRIVSLGFNVVRLPFSYKNFLMNDGSDNDVGFTRIDWVIAQAKRVGIYVIPVYHIWDTQQQRYSMISENNNEGQASRDRAGELWKKIVKRYINEPTIAAWDAINEPTGSWGDLLQRNLYDAIRSVDKDRIIIQASIGTNPSQYGWTNVIYTQHEYQMMGSDLDSNRNAYSAGPGASISDFNKLNIPTYIGEFMADGSTLDMMLQNLNNAGVWWSSWTLKTVQMDRWGLFNFASSMSVNVASDSYDSIRNKWSNMGGLTRQGVADQYQSHVKGSRKRAAATVDADAEVEVELEARAENGTPSPRVERDHGHGHGHQLHRARIGAHAGRSRRMASHGLRAGSSF